MQEDYELARKAAAQILRGWKSAGLDFLPHLPQTASIKTNRESELVKVTPGGDMLLPANPQIPPLQPLPSEPQEAPTDMPPAKKPQLSKPMLPEVDRAESSPIWPDTKRLGKETRLTLLDEIRSEVVQCTRCKELASCRTQTVFGVGNVRPRLCFFGEAPGADEDKQGEPFVGRAGQLLDKIIEAMTLKRSDVYILNTLKCRPPGNRTPLPDEVENCRSYFTRQLEILRPEFLVCLGACAAQALLQTKETIGRLRGKAHDFRGIKVYATYHPAYLLRNPPAKRDVWEDMKVVMTEMGIPIPKT